MSDCNHFWSSNSGVQECLFCHAKRPAPSQAVIHIYAAKKQPATNYVDISEGRPIRFRCSPLALRYCSGCGKRRRAKNLVVQVYYDEMFYWCRDEKNCRKK